MGLSGRRRAGFAIEKRHLVAIRPVNRLIPWVDRLVGQTRPIPASLRTPKLRNVNDWKEEEVCGRRQINSALRKPNDCSFVRRRIGQS